MYRPSRLFIFELYPSKQAVGFSEALNAVDVHFQYSFLTTSRVYMVVISAL